jgi:Secretion system C-terminal sorting domain
MKKLKLLLFLLFVFAKSNAQQNVVVSGANATGSGGSASYSIGQIDYITATGTGGTATQGVQQPFEIVTLSGQEFTEISLQLMVYPNPTSSLVNLKIDNFNLENLSYQLIDLNGREILNKKITESETQIQLENNPSDIYLLNVNQENKTIKTFKIFKNN